MELRSLSASSAQVYEGCAARWKVEYGDKAPSMSGSAASLGTACHEVLERWVADGHYLADYGERAALSQLRQLWEDAYWRNFHDRSRFNEGWELVKIWYERSSFEGIEVLSTETKETFPLPTSAGPVPFNYIIDRMDRLPAKGDDGGFEIRVVDYKTTTWRLNPEDLSHKVQPRAYALAAWLKYPDAKRIWVSFDQLRHERIGLVFTPEECQDTLRYLTDLAERIIADEEAAETLNPDCRWCIRKHRCELLGNHMKAAGNYVVKDIADAMKRRVDLDVIASAVKGEIEKLDEMIGKHLEAEDLRELELGGHRAEMVRGRGSRVAKPDEVAKHVPIEDLLPYLKLNIGDLDEFLKAADLDADTESCIRQTIERRAGRLTLKVRAV